MRDSVDERCDKRRGHEDGLVGGSMRLLTTFLPSLKGFPPSSCKDKLPSETFLTFLQMPFLLRVTVFEHSDRLALFAV